MTNLTPQQLQQILALRQRQGVASGPGQVWYDPNLTTDDPNGYILHQLLGQGRQGGDAETTWHDPSRDQNFITKLRPDTGGGTGDQWDLNGNYLGTIGLQDGGGRQMNTAIALMAGGYFGGGALNAAVNGGAAAGGAAAAGASPYANGAFLGEGVASGIPAWDAAAIKSAIASGQLGTAASYFGQTLDGATALQTLGKTLSPAVTNGASLTGTGPGASAVADAASTANTAGKVLKGGSNLGGLLGAAAGALDSQDRTDTTSRDPWAPAQPYLRGLLSDGAGLYDQYKREPFSQAQQTAYGNFGGVLDVINANAGGLLSGFQANASGANNFVRGQQRPLIGSNFSPTAAQWQPGLLQAFGTRG